MITVTSALLAALMAFEPMFGANWIGAIRVGPQADGFVATAIDVRPTPAGDGIALRAAHLHVAGDTGAAGAPSRIPVEAAGLPAPEPDRATRLSAAAAFEAALTAVREEGGTWFEGGTVVIVLRGGDYVVTLPNDLAPGARGADYAHEVRVDGDTGAIVEMRAAS